MTGATGDHPDEPGTYPFHCEIHADMTAVLSGAEIQKSFDVQGLDLAGGSPQAFADFVRAEAAKFARIAKAGNISVE